MKKLVWCFLLCAACRVVSPTLYATNITNYPVVTTAAPDDWFLLSNVGAKTNRNLPYPDLYAQLATNLEANYLNLTGAFTGTIYLNPGFSMDVGPNGWNIQWNSYADALQVQYITLGETFYFLTNNGGTLQIPNLVGTLGTSNLSGTIPMATTASYATNTLDVGQFAAYTNGTYYANGVWGQTNPASVIQAVVNLLPSFNATKRLGGGGRIKLQVGTYSLTNTIYLTNNGVCTWILDGGGVPGCLLMANGNYEVLHMESTVTNDACLSLICQHITFVNASTTAVTNLVYTRQSNKVLFDDCTFADWNNWTNQANPVQIGIQNGAYPGYRPSGLVGIYADESPGTRYTVQWCNFINIAAGIVMNAGHANVQSCDFQNVGTYHTNSASIFGTLFPSNTVLSLGPSIWTMSEAEADVIDSPAFFQCACWGFGNQAFDQVYINPQDEGSLQGIAGPQQSIVFCSVPQPYNSTGVTNDAAGNYYFNNIPNGTVAIAALPAYGDSLGIYTCDAQLTRIAGFDLAGNLYATSLNGPGTGISGVPHTGGTFFGTTITATNGFASYGTNVALVIVTTGITNKQSVNYRLMGLTGVSVVQTNPLSHVGFSRGSITVPTDITLQPNEFIQGTSVAVQGQQAF